MKFCLLTLTGEAGGADTATFSFFAYRSSDLAEQDRRFTLTPEDLQLLNPNTRSAPVFRSRADAELTKKIYRRVPVLIRERDPQGNPWGIQLQQGLFNMTSDSHLFHTALELENLGAELDRNVWRKGAEAWLPLYEGRLGHQFNHRFASSDGTGGVLDVQDRQLRDPMYLVMPAVWVSVSDFKDRLSRREIAGSTTCLLGFRRVARNTDERTVIAALLPWGPASYGWILTRGAATYALTILTAIYNSFVFDYCARNSLSQPSFPQSTFEQLPTLPPAAFEVKAPWATDGVGRWIRDRVLQLTFVSADLADFAAELGYTGEPFDWDPESRRHLRAELDAACFHLYGLDRPEVEYVMETFPIVRRKDEAAHGEFLTKRLILEQYDDMPR